MVRMNFSHFKNYCSNANLQDSLSHSSHSLNSQQELDASSAMHTSKAGQYRHRAWALSFQQLPRTTFRAWLGQGGDTTVQDMVALLYENKFWLWLSWIACVLPQIHMLKFNLLM